MKFAIVVLATFTVTSTVAFPKTIPPIPILRQLMATERGVHKSSYETGHGIIVDESGSQKQVGSTPEEVGASSSGSYSYTSPEGTLITMRWMADENGFQPSGEHLPTPPPTPVHVEQLLASLKV